MHRGPWEEGTWSSARPGTGWGMRTTLTGKTLFITPPLHCVKDAGRDLVLAVAGLLLTRFPLLGSERLDMAERLIP